MADLARTVVEVIRRFARGRRLRVGLLGRRGLGLIEAVAVEGHATFVLSDHFWTLLAAHQRLQGLGLRHFVALEARLDRLPLAPASLDVLALPRGLPTGRDPEQALVRLRELIAPGGLLIWPHPITDGVRGRLGRLLVPWRPGVYRATRRHHLCAWTMGAGYGAVTQALATGSPIPWAVTTGTTRPAPS